MGGAVDPLLDLGSERAERGKVGTLAPFAHALFASVWLANTVSNFGGQVQGVGAAWLMTSLTQNPMTVSLVIGAALSPILLLSLIAGAIADAFDRRRVLLAAQMLMFASSVALAGVTASGLITPASLIALTFVLGCGFALNGPAWQAAVRELVPGRHVPAAISLNIVGFNLSRTAGPALGGVVVAWGGAQASFTLNALSYLGLLAVLAVWLRRPLAAPTRRPEAMATAIRGGVAHCFASKPLRRILVRVTLFGVALGALLGLIPIVARQLGAGPTGLGVIVACSGGGAVLGALAANCLRARVGDEPLLIASVMATAAAIAVIGVSDRLWITAGAEVVTGFVTTLVYTSLNVRVQALAPRQLLGRIVSIHQMGALGGLAVGAWLWGGVAEATSVGAALLGASVAMAALLLLIRLFPLAAEDEPNIFNA